MPSAGIDIGEDIGANEPGSATKGASNRCRILASNGAGRRIVYCWHRVRRAISFRMMTSERELWACALLVEREQGDNAAVYIAERIGALALEGDAAGVARWKAIAEKLSLLWTGERPLPM
jgi:hypothetical protein